MKTKDRITSYTNRAGRHVDIVKETRRQKRRFWVEHCSECGRVFFASRSDAMTCSAACRQRRYRRAKKLRVTALAALHRIGEQLQLL